MATRTVEEERLHRKQRLAGALRIFGRFGFGEGVAGHITVRDPEFPDHFWVNPLGLSFRHMRVSDLILVNHHGEVVYGKHSVNRAAYVLHAAVHTARPDVIAAAHAHSVYGKAFSSLGIPLDPLTQDSCAFYEQNVVIADHGGAVVFEEAAGRDFAEAFGNYRAAIHQNHGHFTVGASVDEAVFWFVCFERCAQAQLAAMAAGTPKHIPHDSAVYTRENAGSAITGWMHFQPLWQEICQTDPDLFD
jgi:ribulose-5-phosphate 4-epimerase/fuculose-1-phosphate aldolase